MVLKVQIDKTKEELAGTESIPTGNVDSLGTNIDGELSSTGLNSGTNNASGPETNSFNTVAADQKAKASGANNKAPEADIVIRYDAKEEDNGVTAEEDINNNAGLVQGQADSGRIAAGGDAAGSKVPGNNQKLADGDDKTVPKLETDSSGNSNVKVPVDFIKPIKPRPNPLSRLSSYTYNFSVYLLTMEDYFRIQNSPDKTIPNGLLLMQSGGINNVTPDGEKRNQHFPLDFYIDNFQMQNEVSGTATGSIHNTTQFQFEITEPNGISLLPRLRAACEQYTPGTKVDPNTKQPPKVNYVAQTYLLKISFQGYDDDGKLVKAPVGSISSQTGDNSAVVEKLIPFRINAINFRIKNQITHYTVSCAALRNSIAFSQVRSTIPFNMELSSGTLAGLLTGPVIEAKVLQDEERASTSTAADQDKDSDSAPVDTYEEDPMDGYDGISTSEIEAINQGKNPDQSIPKTAPKKANAAVKKKVRTLSGGLTEALNKIEKERADKDGGIANVYKVVFEEGAGLADATLRRPGGVNRKDTPMQNNQGKVADSLLGSKQAVTKSNKNWSIIAGTSITQFIELAVRTSSYITDQQLYIVDEKTGKVLPNENNSKTAQWFKIVPEAKPIGYDPTKNDYAYEITYYIKRYQINDLKSAWFPSARYRGTHKRYDYWFTGQNTEIVDYEANFDHLYYIVQADLPVGSLANRPETNARELEKRFFQTRSNETSQGGEKGSTEPAANAASILYSPSDQGMVSMSILGDPDWFIQNEVYYGIKYSTNSPFMPDGSVNYDAGEVLFEVNFNAPEDYNMERGIMEVFKNNYNSGDGQPGDAENSFVYRANMVTSIFSKGMFTQTIEGTLMRFPLDKPEQEVTFDNIPKEREARLINDATVKLRKDQEAIATQIGATRNAIRQLESTREQQANGQFNTEIAALEKQEKELIGKLKEVQSTKPVISNGEVIEVNTNPAPVVNNTVVDEIDPLTVSDVGIRQQKVARDE